MRFGGLSVIQLTGIVNGLLICFQAASGLRLYKVPFRVHRQTGIALILTTVVHAILALLANY